MSDVMDKIAKLAEFQDGIKAIQITKLDRIELVRPIMDVLKDYGITSFQIRIPFPSFNDGDPCYPYVSETLRFEAPDLGEDDQILEEVYLYAFDEIFEEYLRITGKEPKVSPPEFLKIFEAYFETCQRLLKANKSPTSVQLTYTWDGNGLLTETEEGHYV